MSRITNLEFQKNNKNRVNIYVDDAFFAGVSLESILKFGIKKDKEINEKQLNEFLLVDEKQKALTKATDLVSRFAKTEKQIRDYLKDKGFCEIVIDETVTKMKEYGFVDDRQYVESFVGFKKNVCGINKIKQELFKKGIPKQLIDEINIENESENACLLMAQKYMKNKEKNKETAVKLNRHLISKGFDFVDVSSAVKKIIKGEDDDWN